MGDSIRIDLERDIQHQAGVRGKEEIKELARNMYKAVDNGSSAVVLKNVIIEDKNVLLWKSSKGNTFLHVAAKYGKVHAAEIIINELPSLLHTTNVKGNTPLHIAASLGHLAMTRVLLDCAKDIFARRRLLRMNNLEKDSVLHVAVRNGHCQIVEFLIDVDQGLTSLINNAAESPLFVAVDRRFNEITDRILAATPKCSYKGRKGMNVLHAAAIRYEETEGFRKSLAILMKSPYAMLEADESGCIPLHYAARFGHVEVVKIFLKQNFDLAYIKNREGMSALHISAKEGHVHVINTIIAECPDTCELLDNKNRTAVHVAAESGQGNTVMFFLETLAFQDLINEQDEDGNTPFHLAAMKGHYELLMMFANDSRIAWMVMNKEGMSTVDIIQSDKQLMSEEKDKILEKLSAEESLERMIHMQTLTMKEQSQQTPEVYEETVQSILEPAVVEESSGELPQVNLLVATLVATVTFAAAFQVPGGYNDNGSAILSENTYFRLFMVCDSLAFGFSAGAIFIHFLFPYVPKFMKFNYLRLVIVITEFVILLMFSAFICGISAVSVDKSGFVNNTIYSCALFSFLFPLTFLAVYFPLTGST